MAYRQPDVQLLLGPGTTDRQDIVRTDVRATDGPRGTTSVGPTDDNDLGPEFQLEFNVVFGPLAGRIAEAAARPEHEPDPEEDAPEVGPEHGMDVDEGSARLPAVSNHHAPGDMPDSHHHRRASEPGFSRDECGPSLIRST